MCSSRACRRRLEWRILKHFRQTETHRLIQMLYSTPASRFYRPHTALTSHSASTDERSSGPAAKFLPAQVTLAPELSGPGVRRLFPAGPQLRPTLAGAPGTAGPD